MVTNREGGRGVGLAQSSSCNSNPCVRVCPGSCQGVSPVQGPHGLLPGCPSLPVLGLLTKAPGDCSALPQPRTGACVDRGSLRHTDPWWALCWQTEGTSWGCPPAARLFGLEGPALGLSPGPLGALLCQWRSEQALSCLGAKTSRWGSVCRGPSAGLSSSSTSSGTWGGHRQGVLRPPAVCSKPSSLNLLRGLKVPGAQQPCSNHSAHAAPLHTLPGPSRLTRPAPLLTGPRPTPASDQVCPVGRGRQWAR